MKKSVAFKEVQWCRQNYLLSVGKQLVTRVLSLRKLKAIGRVALPFVGVLMTCSAAHAFCFGQASQTYGINEFLLRAIAQHESGMRSELVLQNTNGSFDIGLMGINTIHIRPGERLYRAGMTEQSLLDPCTNVMTGAYLLRLKMERLGNTWTAVGAYHSMTEEYNARYQSRIWASLQKVLKQAEASGSVRYETTPVQR